MILKDTVGNTPIIKLENTSNDLFCDIYVKMEFLNPWGSIKDRAAKSMLESAIKSGDITKNTILVEATTGNTGISLAGICASMGIKLIIVMPEYVSEERKKLLTMLGAQIVLTERELNYAGAVKKAQQIAQQTGHFLVDQGNNPANPQAHQQTGREIIDFFSGTPDIFIAGIGTGGHCNGIGNTLKQHNPNTQVIAIEPSQAAVLSGITPLESVNSNHGILGIGPGIIANTVDTEVIDKIYVVDEERAFTTTRDIIKNEGLLIGISSGASLTCAIELAKKKENEGKTILTVAASQSERYFSAGL
ncbi:PLP-dependent cysteine synthase family protein [Vibrio ostreicida]|uniref:cysteine synthase n=1 Tax=Vibrio ostreicida TaxID=526588 RepID=A0ABT8C149_9VIBR|nr:cysteine synthase family protein [Vibrio ostreicida]MDN3612068.1 cysteine synthase family protein [Vibrio ostreicida]NPD08761.1 cysteine synthase family protein [Vibrio ostreicida]